MNIAELKSVASAIVRKQKGVLAADESSPTIKKRFDSIKVESTEENRRRYREILFTTEGIERYIGGVILFDETLPQGPRDGGEVVTSQGLGAVFAELDAHRRVFDGMLLKPNMVIPGMKCPKQASVQQVAEATMRCLTRYVPAGVPGIVFLSGGQSAEDGTDHLNAMNPLGT